MLPSEMKEYCATLKRFQIKVNVRLKNESQQIQGRVTGIESKHFLLEQDANKKPLSLSYVTVANITNA